MISPPVTRVVFSVPMRDKPEFDWIPSSVLCGQHLSVDLGDTRYIFIIRYSVGLACDVK
jgi:hypothetical protein